MAANQQEIEDLQKSWKQKYDESQRVIKVLYFIVYELFYSKLVLQEKEEQEKRRKKLQRTTPHLWNLHEDSQLTHVVVHLLHKGSSVLGREKDSTKTATAIVLNGLRYSCPLPLSHRRGSVHVVIRLMSKMCVDVLCYNFTQYQASACYHS